MNLKSQANSVIRSGFYQLRQLKTIHRFLTFDAAKTLVNEFISRRVDYKYCNSLYYGTTDAVHKKLQSIMSAAARLITGQRVTISAQP